MADKLQRSLRADPDVLGVLRQMPRNARSVANAVQLWSGAWISSDALGGPAILDPIRKGVLKVIDAAPPACRTARVQGPRLVIVPDGGAAFVLGFGSGTWSWAELAQPEADPISSP